MTQAVYNHGDMEKKAHAAWAKNKTVEKIVTLSKKRKKFYLLDGPPYVNGTPHVGHVKTTLFKDMWGKFKYMQGFAVWFQPGFDCGGLPIENKVEKELHIQSKNDIETKVGVSKFIESCQRFAKGNEPVWIDYYKKIGAWRGWLDPYLTSENYYYESGWWTVKQWFDKGLFVEGTRPGHWCPHCETVLAGIEASESYKNVTDPSIFIKFPVKGKKQEYVLAWTTTPWTLPANVALLVHPEEMYVKVRTGNEILILAEKRVQVLNEFNIAYTIEEKFPGKELIGLRYTPILETTTQKEAAKHESSHQVYASIQILKKRVASKTQTKGEAAGDEEVGHVVTMDAGTGIVHVAPGHGDDKIGKHYNLYALSPVDEKGCFTNDVEQFAGIFVKKADKEIIKHLQEKKLLLAQRPITHAYPLCWRCKTPLLFRMSRQWFLKMDVLREKILRANKKVQWLPEFARERYANLVEEAPDWAVTRQRYWGIPLPIWVCEGCQAKKVIGSREELRAHAVNAPKGEFDLHKHVVDTIKLTCTCGKEMTREKDIMDVWFDSGIAPWASLGYPFKNKELFERLWNVDLVDESQDQVRAWFNTLMVCGMATFDTVPYKTVCLNGWTLDEKGEKMSKSLGNVISAQEAYEALGADVLRLYIAHDNTPWETQKFSLRRAKETGKQLLILWNAYQYFKTYGKTEQQAQNLRAEDAWILSRLHSLIQDVTRQFEAFEFHFVSRNIIDFVVNDLSRTYIKLVRDRSDDAVNYVFTHVFESTMRMLASICPFMADVIYNDLFNESVHLQSWPHADEKRIRKNLEDQMVILRDVIEQVNSLRKEQGIKLRWPVAYMRIQTQDKTTKDMIKTFGSVLKEFANVTCIEEKDEGNVKKEFATGSVYISTQVLEPEALLRETLREIQKKRKEQGLVVTDKIAVTIDNQILKVFSDEIQEKVGAQSLRFEPVTKETGTASFKKETVKFSFKRVR